MVLAAILGFAGAGAIQGTELEGDLEKTFAVTPGGDLAIQADRGSIELKVGADDTLKVKVQRKARASSTAKAEEILAAHEVTFHQDGNRVVVEAKSPRLNRGWSGRGQNLEVHYEVTLPRRFNPDLHTAGGSIRVPDLAGAVRTQTAGGSIRVGRTEGSVWARTAGGSINVAAATGEVDAETAGGGITVGEGGAGVRVKTAGGSIDVGKVQGRVDARTAGGGIVIGEARAAVRAVTSGGSIRVGLAATPEEDCEIETSAGSIDLQVPASIAANLDAKTSAGTVASDVPVRVQGQARRSALEGQLGEGGKRLKLRTSAGSIRIRARAPQG
jgi:DUF4097 and DUF4098 domain-containing protein YvlB